MKALEDLKELIESEIKKINKKGDLTTAELESVYYAVDVIKDIDEIMGKSGGSMEGYSGYAPRRYSPYMYADGHDMDGNSYGYHDGVSYRRGRDARTGRYVSRDGHSYNYSRDEARDRMFEKLERMKADATDERTRQAIDRCMDEIEG